MNVYAAQSEKGKNVAHDGIIVYSCLQLGRCTKIAGMPYLSTFPLHTKERETGLEL